MKMANQISGVCAFEKCQGVQLGPRTHLPELRVEKELSYRIYTSNSLLDHTSDSLMYVEQLVLADCCVTTVE